MCISGIMKVLMKAYMKVLLMIIKGKCTSTACVQFCMVLLTLLLGLMISCLCLVWYCTVPHTLLGAGCNLDATEEHNRKCCYLWLTDKGVKQKFSELSKATEEAWDGARN